jgi:hypothetical protein
MRRKYLQALIDIKEATASSMGGKNVYYVDGTNGSDGNDGKSLASALATIDAAVGKCGFGDVIYVLPIEIAATDTDPGSYTENIVVDVPGIAIIGISRGLTQGGQPQVKVGDTTTDPIMTISAPGCLITGLGFNGSGATGGGILLNDDGGSTAAAFGTTVKGCHFKNCKGTTATDCRTGGAIMWSANGGAWQTRIEGNVFYKNVGDVVLKGTSSSVPQDVVICNNKFLGLATSVDCHLYLAGGSGMASVLVDSNVFADVLPALGSGSVTRYVEMTGCTGIFSNNFVGGSYTTTGWGAARAAGVLPTTVGIVHNYSDAGLIVRQ